MVRGYSRGERGCEVFRITVELPQRLVGIAAFHGLQVNRNGVITEHPYISIISVSERFRGKRKDGLRLGDHVLTDVLGAIAAHPRWGSHWDVFAAVDPTNRASMAMFERHGFVVVQEAPPGRPDLDCILARPGRPA